MRDYMGLLRVIEEEKSAMYAVRLNPVADSALLCQYRARYRACACRSAVSGLW